MRLERCPAERARPVVVTLWGGALLAAVAALALWIRLDLPRPICRMRAWTGIPCPTCGSTRMIEALFAGDLLGAFAWNPLVFVALVFVALWIALRGIRVLFGLPAWRIVLTPYERRVLLVLALALVAAGWTYLVRHGV